MDLISFDQPARVWKQGEQMLAEVARGTKIKVQLTGDASDLLLHEGPGQGKKWTNALIRIEVREVDA